MWTDLLAALQEAACAGIAAALVVFGGRLLGFHEPTWIIGPFGVAGAAVGSLRTVLGKRPGRGD